MPGIREILEERYDQINAGETEVPQAGETAPETVVTDEPLADDGGGEDVGAESDRARDDQGRFVAQEDTKPEQARTPPPSRPGQGAAAGAVSPPQAALAAPPAFKAPQSWKPAQREKWNALPPDVQAEVVRREREVTQALQQKAEAEKGVTPWQEVVRPYEAQIRQLGVEPVAYVGDLLKTAHALTYSQEPQKADLLAHLALQFGITPQSLDRALVARLQGQVQSQPQAQPQQSLRDPRLDEFFAKQQQESAQEADDTAAGFAETHDFFPDVAEEMANILDGWKAAGKERVSEEDLERAYRMACSGNEDVLAAMEQRKAAESVRTQMRATEQAKAATSSVGSRPAAGAQAQPKGLRAILESRYDELEQ